MKHLQSADFRKTYTRETDEVCTVTSYETPIGYWVPADHPVAAYVIELEEQAEAGLLADKVEPVAATPEARMTIRPVKAGGRSLVATEKRVMDPMELREKVKAQEHARLQDPQLGRRLARP